VLFADNVNTNPCAVKSRGNIGFIPVGDTNIGAATNSNPTGRSLNTVYSNATALTVIRPAILVDVTNQVFVYTTNYLALESPLRALGSNLQAQLLSNPAGDWYMTNAGPGPIISYLRIKILRLNESCAPIVAFQSDWATTLLWAAHQHLQRIQLWRLHGRSGAVRRRRPRAVICAERDPNHGQPAQTCCHKYHRYPIAAAHLD